MTDSMVTPERRAREMQSAGGLDLGGGATTGLAHLGEDLAEAQVVPVHRDVELAAAGVDGLGDAGGALARLGPGVM